jgi:RNase P/RNase MRP subunit POP5
MSKQSSTPSAVKPSQRERKRYVLLHVESGAVLPRNHPQRLVSRIEDQFGLMQAAKASVAVAKVYAETNHVILRVAHDHTQDLFEAARSVTTIAGHDVTITTEITSGIIKQVKDYYKNR